MAPSWMYWANKAPYDNDWRPRPGQNPVRYLDNLPGWMHRIDFAASVVDAAPFCAGAGGLAHLSQFNQLGWTVPASIFRNARTMATLHLSATYLVPCILILQVAGVEYRNVIPRWASEREKRRDEEIVREHVEVGALADLAHREYLKAHGY